MTAKERPVVANRQCLRVGHVLRNRKSRAAGFGGCVAHENAQRSKDLRPVPLRDRETHGRHDHLCGYGARVVPQPKRAPRFDGKSIYGKDLIARLSKSGVRPFWTAPSQNAGSFPIGREVQ